MKFSVPCRQVHTRNAAWRAVATTPTATVTAERIRRPRRSVQRSSPRSAACKRALYSGGFASRSSSAIRSATDAIASLQRCLTTSCRTADRSSCSGISATGKDSASTVMQSRPLANSWQAGENFAARPDFILTAARRDPTPDAGRCGSSGQAPASRFAAVVRSRLGRSGSHPVATLSSPMRPGPQGGVENKIAIRRKEIGRAHV